MSEYGQLPGQQFYLELTIKGNKYNPLNISYLIIREWIFNPLPYIEIQFADNGFLMETFPLEDGEDIQVTLGKNEDDENPLRLTFSLNDYTVSIAGDNRRSFVNLNGFLKASDMFTLRTRSFSKQNSSLVLSTIANESNIPFSNPFNITPSDNMTWIQNSQSNFDFIRHVLRRSYVPDDMLMFYATTDNKFVLNSLNSSIGRKDTKKSKFSVENYERNIKDDEDKDDTIWFTSYSMVNNSGFFNKRIGYGFEFNYWNLEESIQKTYSKIPKMTALSFRNKEIAGKPVIRQFNIDMIEANIYGEEYFESELRNQFLKNNFFANSLVLNINALSKVSLMDKIFVDIPSMLAEEESNEAMSGFYLVAGVQHEVSNGGIYKKKLALGRNGMEKSPDVKNYGVETL